MMLLVYKLDISEFTLLFPINLGVFRILAPYRAPRIDFVRMGLHARMEHSSDARRFYLI